MTDTAVEQRREQLRSELATHTIYELLGGAEGVRAVVDRFYDLMGTDPAFAPIRLMHAPDLAPMRVGLTEWLTGWLGGPPLYVQRKGTVCITGAHMPFRIDETAAVLWIDCMTRAMTDTGVPERYREVLLPALGNIATMLRNDGR